MSPSALRRIAVAAVVAAGVGSALAADTRFDRGRLFRIERTGTPASYVYGTLHSNDARVATLPPAVTAALDASRSAAFETLLLDADVDAFLAAARYDDGRRLVDQVGPATLARIREALGADAPDTAVLAATKPWAILLMLAQPRQDGPVALDELLKIEARSRRLAVFGLELPDEQVASLDAVPLPSQLALVEWALATRERRSADLEAATRAWLAGDLAKLRALAYAPAAADRTLAPHFAALTKHLITDRNVVMAHRLHLPLARGRVFVAVGALHLQGRDGLLALIAKQGYRVTRVL